MSQFGKCYREMYDRGSPPPIPKPTGCTASASSVCRNAPNFRRRVWGPAQGPHARDERKRTTNASCVTCGKCFTGFRCEKSYKIRTASERDKFWRARPAWSLLPVEKNDRLWRMRPGEVRPRVPSAHTKTTWLHSKCQFGLPECTQLLAARVGTLPGTTRQR